MGKYRLSVEENATLGSVALVVGLASGYAQFLGSQIGGWVLPLAVCLLLTLLTVGLVILVKRVRQVPLYWAVAVVVAAAAGGGLTGYLIRTPPDTPPPTTTGGGATPSMRPVAPTVEAVAPPANTSTTRGDGTVAPPSASVDVPAGRGRSQIFNENYYLDLDSTDANWSLSSSRLNGTDLGLAYLSISTISAESGEDVSLATGTPSLDDCNNSTARFKHSIESFDVGDAYCIGTTEQQWVWIKIVDFRPDNDPASITLDIVPLGPMKTS